MAQILLLHSVLGLRPLERDLASRWQARGHDVALPDLYGGGFSDDYDTGFRLYEETGSEMVTARARRAHAAAPGAVLVGISMGTAVAARLWTPQTPGALMLCGVAPPISAPPPGMACAAHVARPDPFDEDGDIDDWAEALDAELHLYADIGHLFIDPNHPDHDAAAAEACLARADAFLDRF
ncbi:dienelactone hydrolase family protein [Limimaricola pyoseonensis]|uniref:Dienelactone hydrolase n=1 Tax=Limimaricola pyoseonensis TaxID=521013 RepID=A0A1G7AQT4_9RHOB|nr:dienelactone hydrolase family protein [Limimaricola pyoseonensis]SDE16276.1 Dienelactone hydrolase [Limimaricola pyoseonensis]